MATLKEELLAELRIRIEAIAPTNQFDPNTWSKTALGLFFPISNPVVQKEAIAATLKGAFEPIMANAGIGMNPSRWETFFTGITVNSTPNSAINWLATVFGG